MKEQKKGHRDDWRMRMKTEDENENKGSRKRWGGVKRERRPQEPNQGLSGLRTPPRWTQGDEGLSSEALGTPCGLLQSNPHCALVPRTPCSSLQKWPPLHLLSRCFAVAPWACPLQEAGRDCLMPLLKWDRRLRHSPWTLLSPISQLFPHQQWELIPSLARDGWACFPSAGITRLIL